MSLAPRRNGATQWRLNVAIGVHVTESVRRLMVYGGRNGNRACPISVLTADDRLKTIDLPLIRWLLWEVPFGAQSAIEFVLLRENGNAVGLLYDPKY
jgi:hypothetical protein